METSVSTKLLDNARLAPGGNHIDGYVQPQDDFTEASSATSLTNGGLL